MQLMIGWSGEVESGQWRKADITLDEVDLNRLLAEFDIAGIALTTTQAFTILELEAQRLIHAELVKRHPQGRSTEQWRNAIKELTQARNDKIESLKALA